jgi:hypothetical protein
MTEEWVYRHIAAGQWVSLQRILSGNICIEI